MKSFSQLVSISLTVLGLLSPVAHAQESAAIDPELRASQLPVGTRLRVTARITVPAKRQTVEFIFDDESKQQRTRCTLVLAEKSREERTLKLGAVLTIREVARGTELLPKGASYSFDKPAIRELSCSKTLYTRFFGRDTGGIAEPTVGEVMRALTSFQLEAGLGDDLFER
jgi:hypothetical protein